MYQNMKMLLCWIFGGPFMAYLAVTNDRGLVLNGLRFSTSGATIFYAFCSAFCFIAATVAGLSLLRSVAIREESTQCQ